MNATEIRKKFLNFFESKQHAIVASDSVVPKDDPTVLFTTAGMQQFKRQFLGNIDDYTRAASSQKCIRTDDLDEVGKTSFHHTFFEMLGNFSFGDYFKKEAISWAWEFLTKEMGIPSEKLWVSIYKDDSETEQIWLNEIKIPQDKLVKLGDKSNFWPSEAKTKGPNGPCGPCSEIFYDYGINPTCARGDKCDPDCSCGRFSEVWNLVFTQFNRKEDGSLEPLPNKNIDTGMGLERLAAVVQGKSSNFETDLFAPILAAIDKEAKKENVTLSGYERFVIADHVRAITFSICDGVIPSNKERGSVIKRLIVDTTDIILRRHGKPFIHKLVSPVVSVMKDHYIELEKKSNEIILYIKKAEEDYVKVYRTRIPKLTQLTQGALKLSSKDKFEKLGELCFEYRTTYGLTLPTIGLVMSKAGLPDGEFRTVLRQYNYQMDDHRELARASSKMAGDVFTDAELDLNVAKTKFLGFDANAASSKILKIFKGTEEITAAQKGDSVKIVLDQTPFYADAGGQIGDHGTLSNKNGSIKVQDTKKIGDVFIHVGSVENGKITRGDKVDASIDAERRLSIMRNHTATHLLQAALREILGEHVQQQGSLVAEDRLRFDFTHPKAVSKKELKKIEDHVNRSILKSIPVQKKTMSLAEAKKHGALAFFAEKYGKTVRVVSIEGTSVELCGGTHLENTGQIGLLKITSESAIAQGIRRIEAKTGLGALELVNAHEDQLNKISEILKSPLTETVDRISQQSKRIKQLDKELEQYRFEAIKGSLDAILKESQKIKDVKVVCHAFKDLEFGILRKVSDLMKQKLKTAIIVLGSKTQGNALLLVAVTDDLIKKGIKANELIVEISKIIDGSGGGRPQMAQAGSQQAGKINHAVEKAFDLIKEKVQL